MVSIYQEHKNDLDKEIKLKLENWDFSRIATIDKIVMRMALSEFLYFEEIPPEVSINEAIELVKNYSTERSSKFINGVLDALFKKLKEIDELPPVEKDKLLLLLDEKEAEELRKRMNLDRKLDIDEDQLFS